MVEAAAVALVATPPTKAARQAAQPLARLLASAPESAHKVPRAGDLFNMHALHIYSIEGVPTIPPLRSVVVDVGARIFLFSRDL